MLTISRAKLFQVSKCQQILGLTFKICGIQNYSLPSFGKYGSQKVLFLICQYMLILSKIQYRIICLVIMIFTMVTYIYSFIFVANISKETAKAREVKTVCSYKKTVSYSVENKKLINS